MDYISPFAMAQNQNPVQGNPFWSGMMGERNQQNAYPFMANALQGQEMDLAKKGMENQEFASPLAQRSRATGLQHGIQTKQSEMETLPFKTAADKLRYQEEIRAMPSLTDEKIAKAGEVMRQIKSQPHKELISSLGSLYDLLHKLPEDKMGPDGFVQSSQRGQVYLRELARWQMTHPGVEIPEMLRRYDSHNTMGDLAAIRFNQLNSPEQVGKEKLAHIQGGYKLEEERMGNASAERRADTAAGAARYGADASRDRGQNQETPARALARLKREIRTNPSNQEAKDELEGYLQDGFSKYLKDHPETGNLQIMSMQGMNDPKKQIKYLERMEELQHDYYQGHGINKPIRKYRIDPATGKVQREKLK